MVFSFFWPLGVCADREYPEGPTIKKTQSCSKFSISIEFFNLARKFQSRRLDFPGKAAQCRQKVCSSKRPPKLEPRSVRPNEVFENLACRFFLNNRELVKAEVFEKRVFEQTTPFKLRNEGGIFLETTLW